MLLLTTDTNLNLYNIYFRIFDVQSYIESLVGFENVKVKINALQWRGALTTFIISRSNFISGKSK